MLKNKADAAPATPPPSEDDLNVQKKKDQIDRQIKPVVVPMPPPAPGMDEAVGETRRLDDRGSSWVDRSVVSAWFCEAAADTKAAILSEIAQGIIARFNADTALAAGGVVTGEWIAGQVLTYQLPITEDDVRQAVTSAFGEAGIQVQG